MLELPYIESPTKLRLPSKWVERYLDPLRKLLSFKNTSAGHQLRKFQKIKAQGKNSWYVQQNGIDALNKQITELEAKYHRCILFEDELGYWTYSGLAALISQKFDGGLFYANHVQYPPTGSIPWNPPPYKPRDFQNKARDLLLAVNHGAVECYTGSGKSFIITMLLQQLGLGAVIMAPTKSIAGQLYKTLVEAFGTKNVGKFWGGKKEPGRHFVVAISNSLNLVEPGSTEWTILSEKSVFIADESHLCPSDTLNNVCMNLMSKAPFRFFLSGTQTRSDGLDLILRGITGEIMLEVSVKEGVAQAAAARPYFYQVTVNSRSKVHSSDAIRENKIHLQENEEVYRVAGMITNRMVAEKRPVLIAIDEVGQFQRIQKYLKNPVGFAHGGVTKANRDLVPQEYWKSNPDGLVEQFNALELPILVGTSCVGIGTDLRPTGAILDLVGLKSETRIRQLIGRGTRVPNGKRNFYYFDFRIANIEILNKHADYRAKIFKEVFAPPKEISLNG